MNTAKILENLLKLNSKLVGVKFFKEDENIPENLEIFPKKLRYCQLLMEARRGNYGLLTAENITCPAAAAAFGFKPLPEKIKSGMMLKTLGLFESENTGAMLMKKIPRLNSGEFKAIAVAPLEKDLFKPDVVVIEDEPEKIMWIILASIHNVEGRHEFSTGVFQATCVDVTIVPYLTKKINASLGCYGCRDATDIKEIECLIGIPAEKMEDIISNLQFLSQKAMKTVRSKKTYKLYLEQKKKGENDANSKKRI